MKKFFMKKVIPIMLLTTLISYTAPVFAVTKDETVYTKLNVKGEQYKTIVSTELKNENNLEKIVDLTNLLNIENTSGDETFSKDGDTLIWDAKGNDIYYQGETEAKLPIELEIKYKLNGEEISAKDIAGKSGKVTIKLEYKNNDEHIVNVNGRSEKMYTPFLLVSGTILRNNNNKNIEVTNGKVINDGTKSIIIGIALPGLQESLGVSKDTINIPSGMEINMDAIDFELDSIITFATPKLLDEEDSNLTAEMKELSSKISLIREATEKLKTGADTLKNGTEDYSQKSELFNGKMEELQNGVGYINNQYTTLDTGINTVNNSTSLIQNGAEQIYNGVQELPTMLGELVTGLDTASTTLRGIEDTQEKILLSETEINAIVTAISNDTTIDATTKTALITKIKTQNATLQKTNEGIIGVATGIETAKDTITANNQKISSLIDGVTQIYNGTSELSKGTANLAKGSNKVKEGLNTLNSSTVALKSADDALTQGAKTISAGASELYEGIETFNNEINKYLNGAINQVAIRAEKLVMLSEEYNNFTKINEQSKGKVKFIMMTDSLKKEEEK